MAIKYQQTSANAAAPCSGTWSSPLPSSWERPGVLSTDRRFLIWKQSVIFIFSFLSQKSAPYFHNKYREIARTVSIIYHMKSPHKHGAKVSNIPVCLDTTRFFDWLSRLQHHLSGLHNTRARYSREFFELSSFVPKPPIPRVIPGHSYSGEFDPNEARPKGAFDFRFKTCVSGRFCNSLIQHMRRVQVLAGSFHVGLSVVVVRVI